jgi:hypothetical protein
MYVCIRGGPIRPLHRDPQWSIKRQGRSTVNFGEGVQEHGEGEQQREGRGSHRSNRTTGRPKDSHKVTSQRKTVTSDVERSGIRTVTTVFSNIDTLADQTFSSYIHTQAHNTVTCITYL